MENVFSKLCKSPKVNVPSSMKGVSHDCEQKKLPTSYFILLHILITHSSKLRRIT